MGRLILRDLRDREFGTAPPAGGAAQCFAGLSLERPRLMGIVNVTPDSFSDGGDHATADAAIAHGMRLAEEGADILDVGGESTRPGADPVDIRTELQRVIPVILGLARRGNLVSVDTRKAEVMAAAAEAGAGMINDVSALTHDPLSLAVAARLGLPVVLMHAAGDPRTMQADPRYDDVVAEVALYLSLRLRACLEAGCQPGQIAIDPGIGFGKTVRHNLELLNGLDRFRELPAPLLVGLSRKAFIGRLTGETHARERVNGSVGGAVYAYLRGAQILRVHDVKATRQALAVAVAAVDPDKAGL